MTTGGELNLGDLWTTLSTQARASGKSADMPGVVATLRERVENKNLPTDDRRRVGAMLHGLSELIRQRGDLRGAVAGYEEAERYFRDANDQALVQATLGKHAEALMALDDYQAAVPLVAERARICREIDDRASLLSCMAMQGKLLHWAGDAEHAAILAEEQEALARELGGDESVAVTLTNRGLLLMHQDQLDEAEPLLEEAVRLLRKGSNRSLLANTIGSQAVIVMQRGNLEKSLELQREAGTIAAEARDHENIAKALAMQAMLLGQLGRVAEALPLAREADQVARSRGLTSLANQMIAPILLMLGETAEDPLFSGGVAPARPVAGRAKEKAAPTTSAPATPPALTSEEVKADYLFQLSQWQKLSFFQRLKARKPELPASLRGDWRTDPLLKGRFHEDAADDIEVLVHDGHRAVSGRSPERIWIHVNGRRGDTWTGTLLNQPHQLQSVHRGSEIQFVARSRTQPLVHVTSKYLDERKVWTVAPCDRCGLPETFSPPSELIECSDARPETRATIRRVTVPCPICDGTQILTRA